MYKKNRKKILNKLINQYKVKLNKVFLKYRKKYLNNSIN